MGKINTHRILANAGIAFFTVAAATVGAGVGDSQALMAGFLGAVIQGGMAACQELKLEAERASDIPTRKRTGEPKSPLYTLF